MIFKAMFCQLFAGCLALSALPHLAYAQRGSIEKRSVVVGVSNVTTAPKKVIVHFVIKNNSKTRLYLTDVRNDDGQVGSLASGEQLRAPIPVTGIQFCNYTTLTTCLSNPGEMELSRFSYIEPDDYVNVSFTYDTANPVDENDSISFSVVLIAKFANEKDETRTGKPISLRFSFPDTPFKR